MRPTSCAFCGEISDNLVEIYPGGSVEERRAFCSLCIETAAHGVSFRDDRELSNRVVLQALYRLVHTLLREVREVRQQQEGLAKRLDAELDGRL